MSNKKDTMKHISRSVRATTAFLTRHGCTPCKGHYGSGYHDHSGFFTSPKGLLWYWSTGDDRWNNNILFRRAEHLKDFVGKTNQYPKTAEEFDGMIAWHDRYEKVGMELHKAKSASIAEVA